ncbi:MAG: hypothetical protein AB8B93_01580 [Pseudomonadales bacterium]
MKPVMRWLLLAVLLTGGAHTHGAESDKTETSAEASEQDTEQQGTEDGFLPSEEISEDFAVSFPVDI